MQVTTQVTVRDGGFRAYYGRSRKRLSRVVEKYALLIANEARRLAPVDTGNLVNSIHHVLEAGALAAVVGTNIEYAIHQEMGTIKMAVQPFLVPAFEKYRSAFIRDVKAALRP